jgi:hypothetical protein
MTVTMIMNIPPLVVVVVQQRATPRTPSTRLPAFFLLFHDIRVDGILERS